ncbi:hypothetical protein ACWEP5_36545 [Nocardia niigatensis]
MIFHRAVPDDDVVSPRAVACGIHTIPEVPALITERFLPARDSAPTGPRSLRVVPSRPPVEPPTRWSADWCSLSYGVDYSFLYLHRRVWPRWPHTQPIVVRLRRGDDEQGWALRDDLSLVIEELRLLTALPLQLGPDFDRDQPPTGFARQEIRVSCLDTTEDRIGWQPGPLGVGGIFLHPANGRIHSGFAVISAATSALGPAAAGLLRHELGHALGLGHAHRQGTVMNDQFLPGTWGLGDRVGLHLAGGGPSVQGCAYSLVEPR